LRGHQGWIEDASFGRYGKTAVTASDDGTIKYWNAADGGLIYTMTATPEGEWLAWTPDGYFNGTPWAMRNLVCVVEGLSARPIDAFFETYHRPDIIAARAKGGDASSFAETGITEGFAEPPEVSLAVRTKSGTFRVPPSEISLRGPSALGSDAGDWLLENGTITVRVTAKDSGGGIDGLRLFVNDKAVGEDIRGLAVQGKENGLITRDFAVPLAADENILRAVSFSRDRTESLPCLARVRYSPQTAEKPRLFLLIAAADTYRNSRYNLNYAGADANAFLNSYLPLAKRLFAEVAVISLFDDRLTKDSFTAAVQRIQADSAPNDVFLFFYAGHGIAVQEEGRNEFFFVLPSVTAMLDPQKLKEGGVSSAEFRNQIAAIPASKQLLLVDACNSGAFASGFAVRGAAEELALAQLARSSGAIVITATTDQQFASEISSIGHGVFTYAVLQGLEGKAARDDGRITANGLKSWVDEAVPELSLRYKGSEQFPTTFMFGQDFPIGLR
jgi:hypothetical protein